LPNKPDVLLFGLLSVGLTEPWGAASIAQLQTAFGVMRARLKKFPSDQRAAFVMAIEKAIESDPGLNEEERRAIRGLLTAAFDGSSSEPDSSVATVPVNFFARVTF
jgi:hypothetical protein